MSTPPLHEDLFERHTMSFGEHLEQLRIALAKSCVWLAIGIGIGFYYCEPVARAISEPFRRQLREYHLAKTSQAFSKLYGSELPSDFLQLLTEQQVMPRPGFELELVDASEPMDFANAASVPKDAWLKQLADGRLTRATPKVWMEAIPDSLNSFGIFEGFYAYLQVSLLIGITVSLPGMFWHIWSFVAAGLYRHERRKVYQMLPLSIVLFIFGAALAYYVMIDLLIAVMLPYNSDLGIEIQPRLKDCFSVALWLPLIFGVCFQLPLVMWVLSMLGIVTARDFLAHQKIAVLAITFLSMLLTPADPYTFFGLMLPLIALFYLGILLNLLTERSDRT